jgi:rhodanese-related sulfurtransferase
MRFLTLLLLFAAFSCKNKPSDANTEGGEKDPFEQVDTTKSSFAYTFTDTILVSLGAKDFAAVCKSKPNMPILDIRSEKEFKAGHIWRAVNIDMKDKDFQRRIAGFGRNQEYAVYCQYGFDSQQVAEDMKRMGFFRIYHLQKGLSSWGDSGQALQLK